MKTPHLTLTTAQQQHLHALTTRGTVSVKTFRRASALLALHAGQSYAAVARTQQVRYATVLAWAKRFALIGVDLLFDQPRSGRPLTITGPERAKLTALACSPAPDGRSQWSLRLLAGKAVALGYCRHLSVGSVHAILNKTRCSLTASDNGVSAA